MGRGGKGTSVVGCHSHPCNLLKQSLCYQFKRCYFFPYSFCFVPLKGTPGFVSNDQSLLLFPTTCSTKLGGKATARFQHGHKPVCWGRRVAARLSLHGRELNYKAVRHKNANCDLCCPLITELLQFLHFS